MFMNLAPAALGINTDLKGTIALAQAHGFEGIDCPLPEVCDLADPRQAVDYLNQAKLRWGGFGLPVDFRSDDQTIRRGFDALRQMAPVAQRINCTRCTAWLLPYHDELDYETNFNMHVHRLRPMVRILADHGIRFGLEFVAPRTMRRGHRFEFIHRLDQVMGLAEAIDVAGTGVLLDSWHWYTSRGTVADITEKLRDGIVYVHINDAPAGREIDEQLDDDRRLPGDTGVIDLTTFIDCLGEVNYNGPVTAEPFLPELGRLPPQQAVARTAEAMRRVMKSGRGRK